MSNTAHESSGEFSVIIVGAGFAGIGLGIRLKQAGIENFTIFERAGEIGGTWRDNHYPGAACDVPSHLYSYSFEPNPNWSRAYAPAEEIQAYLLRCVEKYEIRSHLRLNTRIEEARFDEATASWTVTTASGEAHQARAVVSCVGGLIDPSLPEIEGLDRYRGKIIHTARWDHDYELAGKRVGVIGTGCSGIQVIPAIADKVASMSVFQRTAAWVMPKRDHVFSERKKTIYARFPFVQKLARGFWFAFTEILGPLIMLNSPRLSRMPERAAMRHLEASVRDPELRNKLTPTFQFGCKRVLISDDYLPTLEREHVELVTDPIARFTDNGVVTADGTTRDLDAVVCATGFDVNFTAPAFRVLGLGGKSMAEVWTAAGAEAYKGLSVAGFPNYFLVMGPNTGPGHTSVLVYSEAQIRYIVQAIEQLKRGRFRYLSVKPQVQRAYNERLQGRMKYTVWSGCKSWYIGADGKNRTLFPGLASEYVAATRRFKPAEYDTTA